ncbi:hypothetical protein GQ54DRAFT_295861 [Martensiomyces pterosporus]|nr:hypothetical protein GQ54DRAFT_295861 [Martensiomyces pterosporus]
MACNHATTSAQSTCHAAPRTHKCQLLCPYCLEDFYFVSDLTEHKQSCPKKP